MVADGEFNVTGLAVFVTEVKVTVAAANTGYIPDKIIRAVIMAVKIILFMAALLFVIQRKFRVVSIFPQASRRVVRLVRHAGVLL